MDNTDKIVQNFGKNAKNYKFAKVFSQKDYLDSMVNLINPKKHEIALDVATGAGHTAFELAKYVDMVIAIDITQDMLLQAQSILKERKFSNVELKNMDASHLDFPDEYFDIITCRFAFHHFNNLDVAIKEIYRVLKPGGRFYILDCSVIDDEAVSIINEMEMLRDDSHVHSYSPKQWQNILNKYTFSIVQLKLLKSRYHIPDWFDRMGTPIKNREKVFGLLEKLPVHLKDYYTFDKKHIDTYFVEILAEKI